jgi:hypothetical protein
MTDVAVKAELEGFDDHLITLIEEYGRNCSHAEKALRSLVPIIKNKLPTSEQFDIRETSIRLIFAKGFFHQTTYYELVKYAILAKGKHATQISDSSKLKASRTEYSRIRRRLDTQLKHLRDALYPPAENPPVAAETLTLVVANVPSAIPIAPTEVRFVTPTSESNNAVS